MKYSSALIALSVMGIHFAAGAAGVVNLTTLSPPAIEALSVLPPDQVVQHTLQNMPQLRSSAINIDLAKTDKTKLAAGPYEWTVHAGTDQRTVTATGAHYQEQEVSVERPLRWFGKADKDIAIGDKGISVAELAHADAWHQARRGLMKDWFDALREQAATALLGQQVEVTQQIRAIADKRVKAGDGAALELLQADTESRRVAALLQQAQQRQAQALQLLASNYPGLPQPNAQHLPMPQMVQEPAAYWLDHILHDNHELQLAQAQADMYTLQANRVASERMPDPTIALRSSREYGGQERVIGVSISFPIPGGARAADSSGAALKAEMAMETLDQTRIQVQATAQRTVMDSTRSYEIWSTMQQVQQQTQQQATVMMAAYQSGESTLTDALNSRRQALDAALAAQSAQIDALAAFARLQLDADMIWGAAE
ncbi:MAG TPA: TolC family protein [Herbaspirillum sp.]|jgi:cobalt-zinc-cadmium efflux system outer membrane protein|nr:TolC family protein [Herbaspirillum sp.]